MKQRILHVMASAKKGGGAQHLKGLLPKLKQLNYNCLAAVGYDGALQTELEELGIQTLIIDLMRSRLSWQAVWQLRQMILSQKPDVVHLHGTRAAFYHAIARRTSLHWPHSVYTIHGLSYRKEANRVRHKIFVQAEKLACNSVTAVCSVSQADLNDLQSKMALLHAVHIPNAVELGHQQTRQQARKQLGVSANAFVIGTVARLVPQKAVHDLIAAFTQFKHPSEVQLFIVGDGYLRSKLQQQTSHIRNIHFLGERQDVPCLLPALDVFVLTSHWEGEPIALLEAMGSGLACVATRTAGASEVIQHGHNGLLVEIGDVDGIIHALKMLCEKPQQRKILGLHAASAMTFRTYARQADQISSLYQQIVVDKRNHVRI